MYFIILVSLHHYTSERRLALTPDKPPDTSVSDQEECYCSAELPAALTSSSHFTIHSSSFTLL